MVLFGKDKSKITEKDVGFAEDSFEALKNAVAIECHLVGNYVSSGNKDDLIRLNKARSERTELMNIVLETLGADVQGQNWCILKHICCMAMNTHELITRCSHIGNDQMADRLRKVHMELYLMYLEILGVNETNISSKSSA